MAQTDSVSPKNTIIISVITAITSIFVTMLSTGAYRDLIGNSGRNTSIRSEIYNTMVSNQDSLFEYFRIHVSEIRKIKLSGISLSRTIDELNKLEDKMRRNIVIDIVFTKFDSIPREDCVPFKYIYNVDPDVDSIGNKLASQIKSFNIINIWKQRLPRIHVDSIDFPVCEKIVCIELFDGKEVCFVELFPVRSDEPNSIYLKLDPTLSPELFKFYKTSKLERYFNLPKIKYE